MLVAVRWTQVRLYYCKNDKSYYIQLGDESFYKVPKNVVESVGFKLQIEIKEVPNITSMQYDKSS